MQAVDAGGGEVSTRELSSGWDQPFVLGSMDPIDRSTKNDSASQFGAIIGATRWLLSSEADPMSRSRILLLGTLLISSLARADVINLDFEPFADSTSLTNQYVGFLFTNTSVWTAGLSLNDLEFPPHSGRNVAVDIGGPITIAFASPVLAFSGFFTYSSALTIDAFDSLNQTVGTTNSAFNSNFVSSGNPPNELLQLSFAGGISSLTISGNIAGSSFALDDASVTTPASGVPEPSSGFLVLSCLLLAGGIGMRNGRIPF